MYIVRNMLENDIKKCAGLFVDAYRSVYSEPWTLEAGEKRIEEIFVQARDLCFVLDVEGEIGGFLAARSFTWFDGLRVWVEEIVIDERIRGQAYGTLMLNTLIAKGKEIKVVGYSLISERGSRAYHCYLDRGFSTSSWIHLEKMLMDDNQPIC